EVGDKSNLILDPDLDSFYAMDLTVVKMPELVDDIAAIADVAADIAARGTVTPDEKTQLALLKGRLESTTAGIDASLASGYSGTADGSLKQELAGPYAANKDAIAKLIAVLEDAVLTKGGSGADGSAIRQAQDAATAAGAAFWNQSASSLGRLLTMRLSGCWSAFWTNLAICLAISLLSLAAAFHIRGQIVGPIARMTQAMMRLAGGDTSIVVPARENKDEVGEMARSLEVFRDGL